MNRINGFLSIDDCKKKVIDVEKGYYLVYIDGEEYYYKTFSYGLFGSELIAYYGAKLLGIDACFYDLAILNGEQGYISKSFKRENENFVLGEVILGDYLVNSMDFIKNMGLDRLTSSILEEKCMNKLSSYLCADYVNTLEIIWQALEYRYGNKIDIEKVMNQFVSMYLFTILFKDNDKHSGNWGVIENCDGIRLAPLFDNELIFYGGFSSINFFVNFMDSNNNNGVLESLRVFFEVSSFEYFELFVEMFEKLTSNFELILEMVEKQIGMRINFMDRNYILCKFNENKENINQIIDSFKVSKYSKILK